MSTGSRRKMKVIDDEYNRIFRLSASNHVPEKKIKIIKNVVFYKLKFVFTFLLFLISNPKIFLPGVNTMNNPPGVIRCYIDNYLHRKSLTSNDL